MRLCVVVGHTYVAKGAKGTYPITNEYEYNTEIAELVYQNAKSRDLEVKVFLRDGIGLKGVYRNVKEWTKFDPVSACVELHFNAFNGKARGTETLYDKDPANSEQFAQLIHNAVCLALGRKDKTDRGIKLISEPSERGYTNLNECNIPSVILEPGFGDNKDDAKLLYETKKQYAKAIVDASIEFLNLLKT